MYHYFHCDLSYILFTNLFYQSCQAKWFGQGTAPEKVSLGTPLEGGTPLGEGDGYPIAIGGRGA